MIDRKDEEFIGLRQGTLTVAQYEVQFTKLSKYAPEMVNTEEKRKRRFLQGLNIELQRSLVSARIDTYADMVEFAQKVEDCEIKWKKIQGSQRTGPRNWESDKKGSTQRQVRNLQKRPGEVRAFAPAKLRTAPSSCPFCGKIGHNESNCWKKAGKCFHCGSTEHKVRNCPIYQSGSIGMTVDTPALRGKSKASARVHALDKSNVKKKSERRERYAS